MSDLSGSDQLSARIKVVGIGGGGGNAVNTMIAAGLQGVDFISANTDAQALAANLAPVKLQLGSQVTKGLGAGGSPEMGRKAATEDVERIREYLTGADMVFITAGMGGGTGTGGAPIVSRIAKELGALTVGVVTKPFLFEGKKRGKQAEEGMRELKASVDTLIAIPNQRLLAVAGRTTSILETFKKADDVLLQAVRGISDLITVHGLINLDFNDVRTIMSEMGMALMGAATAAGENRAVEAAQKAISSPLLEDVSIQGARGVLINITGGLDLGLHEVNEAATLIQEEADDEANIIFGAVIDESMNDQIRITVIATGFGEPREDVKRPPTTAAASNAQAGSPRVAYSREGTRDAVREAAAAAQRRVVRVGVIDDIEGTMWRRSGGAANADRGEPIDLTVPDEDDSLDIPTFLRKQAD
ncbi:MAG: cell division protein FtsZ [Deltaproteobacteria bacterium]|nr:MAG: cell division protein FtsZ [Deltaproteobacteria bacterium]